MSYSSRENTNKLLDLVDEGVLDPIQVLKAALSWHEDLDVGKMAEANEFFLDNDDDEEDEEEDEEPYKAGEFKDVDGFIYLYL